MTWASDFHSVTIGVKDVDSAGTVKTDSYDFQYLDPKGVAATKAEYTAYTNRASDPNYVPKMFVVANGYTADGETTFALYEGKVEAVANTDYFLVDAGAEYKWTKGDAAVTSGKLFGTYSEDKPALAGELTKNVFDAATIQRTVTTASGVTTDKYGRYVVDAGDYSAWFATKDQVTPEETNPAAVSAVNGWAVNTDSEAFWNVEYPAYDAYEFDTDTAGKAQNRALEAKITLNEAAIKAQYGASRLVGTAEGTVGIVANVGTPDTPYFAGWYLEDNDTYNKDYSETYDNTITYDANTHGIVFYHMPKNVSVKYYLMKEAGKGYQAPKDADWVDTFPGIKDAGTYYVAVKFIAEKSKVEYVLDGDSGLKYKTIKVNEYTVPIKAKQTLFKAEFGKLSKADIEAALAALFEVGTAPDSQDKVSEAFQKYLVLTGVFEDAGTGTVTAKIDAKKLSDDTELAKALSNYKFGTDNITLSVEKADNDITIKTSAKTVKGVKKGKLKKNKSFKISYTVQQGTANFTKVSGNSKIKVSSAGKVTVKKGIKKGTYKVKVKAVAKGTANYAQATATKTIKIKVK